MKTHRRTTRSAAKASMMGLAILALIVSGSSGAAAATPEDRATLDEALAAAFRIDLSEVDVTLDFHPDAPTIEGRATLTFTMRTGQQRALFHFDPRKHPVNGLAALRAITLDGESLDPMNVADLQLIRFGDSDEDAFELQRDLAPDIEHVLVVEWSSPNYDLVKQPGWLRTRVNDTPGKGNEALWPTINSPEEQARHTIDVRIQDEREYFMIGSGKIASRVEGDVQIWSLDTEREISSYTVMLAAMPREEVIVETFDAGPVPVTIASTVGPERIEIAVERTHKVLARLAEDFGPFPMPSMQILLIPWSGGMEYYGATVTGLGAVAHELVHMYWGTSAVQRTWRDTWLDEALVEWWLGGRSMLPEGFKSDIVGARSPIKPAFDTRAYGRGAQVIRKIEGILGGREAMTLFLADLYQRRAFEPFTTHDFIDDIIAWSGDEGVRADVERWLYPVVVKARDLRGVWRRHGYGQLFEFESGAWIEYEVTELSCRRTGRISKEAARSKFRGIAISEDGDQLELSDIRDLNRLHLERVDTGLPVTCDEPKHQPFDPVRTFDIFWRTFAENYPFFSQRGIDWDAQYALHRPLVDDDTTRAELEERMVLLALPVEDGHATLRGEALYSATPLEQRLIDEWQASGTSKGFGAYVQRERKAFDRRAEKRYLPDGLEKAGRGRVRWGRLSPELGYLRVEAMGGYARRGDLLTQVEKARRIMRKVIRDLAGTEAMVVDLRWNGGGRDEVALAMAGFFTDQPQIAFTKRAVEGDGLGPVQTVHIWPQTRTPFVGRVFVLTSGLTASAAEVFNLALRARGDVVQVGEPSMGALSDSLDRELPNGWSFSLSNEIYLDPDDTPFEGSGIPVDEEATVFAPGDRAQGIDPGIERALEAMARR